MKTMGVGRSAGKKKEAQTMTDLIRGIAAATVLLGIANASWAQTIPYQAVERPSIGFGLGQTEPAPGRVFQPRVEASMQYFGNMTLAASGEPQIDLGGLEIAPGFYASRSTESVTGAIDYSLIGRFWEDSDYDDVSHRLAANGQWIALPDWFRVRAQAAYGDSVIDPVKGLNYGGLGVFSPANLSEVATASASPVVQHRFGDFELVAQYDYGRVWYLDEGKGQPVVGFVTNQDSQDQTGNVSFGSVDRQSRLAAKIYYNWQHTDFEEALDYAYERAGVDAGYRLSRTLTLVGDVGRESDLDVSTTEGGLDANFWNAGLRWSPNDRTSAEARVGERYFGDGYSFSFNHRARLLEFDASYSEQPAVETRLLSLGDFDPGQLPPGLPEVGLGRVNSTPYLGKDSHIGIAAVGARTRVDVTGYQFGRDYLRGVIGDETTTGVEIDATRQFASNLSGDLSLYYSDFERIVTSSGPSGLADQNIYDTGITLRLNRTSGPRLTLSGETGFINRTGDANHEGWWVALRARWTP